MPMTGAGMRDAVAAALGVSDPSALTQIGKMTTAIVAYIQANALVSTTDTVPALGLIAPPGAGGGPVTGAANGTGTGTVA